MENQENSAIITILNEMRQDMNKMKDNILNEMRQSIGETNKRIDSLEEKFNNKFDSLEKKVDNNSVNIIKILTTTSKMQKDIEDLREDVETVYSLEKDSRKQLKRLL